MRQTAPSSNLAKVENISEQSASTDNSGIGMAKKVP
jgi:hypothetical protein